MDYSLQNDWLLLGTIGCLGMFGFFKKDVPLHLRLSALIRGSKV